MLKLKDNYSDGEFVQQTNSLRGDQVRQLLKKAPALIISLFNRLSMEESEKEEIETEKQNTIKLWKCWAKLEPFLTDVTDKAGNYLPDLSKEEIFLLNEDIKSFEEAMRKIFPRMDDSKENVLTPYLHVLFKHFIEITEKHNRLSRFQNQGPLALVLI